MPRRTLDEMAAELYQDDAVRAAVVEDAKRLKTVERIESGELTLPSEQDALIWHQRQQGEQHHKSEIDLLKDRLAALEGTDSTKPKIADKLRASDKRAHSKNAGAPTAKGGE